MGDFQIAPGFAFLRPSGPSGLHLFLIIQGPCLLQDHGSNPVCLLTSICSIKQGIPFDDACVLNAGDHPFLKHPSYVAYRHMESATEEHIKSMLESRVWQPADSFTPQVIDKVVSRAGISKLIPRIYKNIF